MNYSIWDSLDNAIEKNIEKQATGHETASLTLGNTSPLPETPPKPKRSQNANTSHIEPLFDEAKIWQENEALIASVPVENIIPLKLGLLEEHILQGLRTGADRTALFLAAILGIAIANNDTFFYNQVKEIIAK